MPERWQELSNFISGLQTHSNSFKFFSILSFLMVNRVAKGDRLERIVKNQLQQEGFIVFKPVRTRFSTQKDIFNLFDICAWHPENGILLFAQCTTDKSLKSKKLNDVSKFYVKILKTFVVIKKNDWILVKQYHCQEKVVS